MDDVITLNSIIYWGRGRKVCVKERKKDQRLKESAHTELDSHRSMQMGMSNYNEIIRIIFELLNFFNEMAITENVLRTFDGTYNLHIKFSG